MKRFLPAVSAAAFIALAACGGGSSNSSDNAAAPADSAAPAASSSAMSGSMGSMGGSSMGDAGAVAAVPASLNCGAVKPVWVNLNTKVYHEPSDPFYGKTKHGEYLCPSTAKKDGYRPAGGGAEGGSMSGHHKKNDSQ
jgi:predicted lipid-binding transport protein (Tim44 family)